MKKSIGDRILVKGGMVCDEDAMGTIRDICEEFEVYLVHVDGDPIEDAGYVNEDGDIVFIYD